MFTQRRVPFSRSAVIAVMLAAPVFFAGTARLSADFVGISFGQNNSNPVSGPSFSSSSLPFLGSFTLPSPTKTSSGFEIAGFTYPVIKAGDVQWTAMRNFSLGSALSITEAIDVADISITSKPSNAFSGTFTLSASIYQVVLGEDGAQPTYTLVNNTTVSTGNISLPTKLPPNHPISANKSLASPTLAAGNYSIWLTSDLNITSLGSGAIVTVDPNGPTYGVSVTLPEPSSRLQFAILSTMLLTGLAGRRWLNRRRFDRAHFAATSLCG